MIYTKAKKILVGMLAVITAFSSGSIVAAVEAKSNIVVGDVNSDGVIDVYDVTYIQQTLAEIIPQTDEFLTLADVYRDGRVNIIDATYLQMYLAEEIESIPIEVNPKPTEPVIQTTQAITQATTQKPTQPATTSDGWNERILRP